MLVVEITIDKNWEWGFKRYTLMYGQMRVCLIDAGFIQLKVQRRTS